MKITTTDSVRHYAEIGDIIYNKTNSRYFRIISSHGMYTILFLDTFTVSTLNYKTIESLISEYFENDYIIIYKQSESELILK